MRPSAQTLHVLADGRRVRDRAVLFVPGGRALRCEAPGSRNQQQRQKNHSHFSHRDILANTGVSQPDTKSPPIRQTPRSVNSDGGAHAFNCERLATAAFTRSGANGTIRKRTPVASKTALAS